MENDRASDQKDGSRPALTGAAHTLPFDKLSPRDFERLCLWLVEEEGYERAEHLGAAGSEQGRDLVAWRGGELWAFQCKRVQRFGPSDAVGEAEKVLALPPAQRPTGLIFLVTCDVSARTRQAVRQRCDDEPALSGTEGLACRFWTGTELDRRVKRHPDIMAEFFAAPGGPALQATNRGVVQTGEGSIAITGDIQGGLQIVQGVAPPSPAPAAGTGSTRPPGPSGPDLAAVRDLLLDAFTAGELRRLVLYTDNAELRPLGNEFAEGDGLAVVVEKAIRFCQSRDLLTDLLREVARERPRRYKPYAHLFET